MVLFTFENKKNRVALFNRVRSVSALTLQKFQFLEFTFQLVKPFLPNIIAFIQDARGTTDREGDGAATTVAYKRRGRNTENNMLPLLINNLLLTCGILCFFVFNLDKKNLLSTITSSQEYIKNIKVFS